MSVQCVCLHKPHFCIVKLGFMGCMPTFHDFVPKHRLWALVRTASVLSCTLNQCFEQKCQNVSNVIFIFSPEKNLCILNGQVFIM